MSDVTVRTKRTVGTGPPPDGLLFGELAYADQEEALYIGRADPAAAPTRYAPGGGGSGTDGASAYEVAIANGFVGTEAEWLASLEGPQGPPGSGGGGTWELLQDNIVWSRPSEVTVAHGGPDSSAVKDVRIFAVLKQPRTGWNIGDVLPIISQDGNYSYGWDNANVFIAIREPLTAINLNTLAGFTTLDDIHFNLRIWVRR